MFSMAAAKDACFYAEEIQEGEGNLKVPELSWTSPITYATSACLSVWVSAGTRCHPKGNCAYVAAHEALLYTLSHPSMCSTQKMATVNELLFKAECCSNCGIPMKAVP
jgi:hypothetical protein